MSRRRINLNQLTLPFGKEGVAVISYPHRARLFLVLATISALSLFVYIYAINATTRNTAIRQSLEREIASLSADLDSLEFTYIQLKNNVTIELAYSYGFKEVKDPLYISRVPETSLSFNTLKTINRQ